MGDVVRIEQRIAVEGGESGASIAVRIIGPEAGRVAARPLVLFGFPGGGMTKAYFDLDAGEDRSFSFAEAMAARGHLTVAVDHLGVGASTRPDDGYRLTVERVAAADAAAVAEVKRRLRGGLDGYVRLNAFSAVGVGHSMGAMITAWMQAHHASFDAIALLGAGPFGLQEYLPTRLKPLAGRPQAARDEIEAIMRASGAPPYGRMAASPEARRLLKGGSEAGALALAEARGELITVCGMFAMIPQSWAPEAAQICEPVLLGMGDQDLGERRAEGPGYFQGTSDLSTVLLLDTGHNHFVYESRGRLFAELAAWAETQAGRRCV